MKLWPTPIDRQSWERRLLKMRRFPVITLIRDKAVPSIVEKTVSGCQHPASPNNAS
jgi:hypothetical protein